MRLLSVGILPSDRVQGTGEKLFRIKSILIIKAIF